MELVVHLREKALSFFLDGDARQRIRVPLLAGPYSRSFRIDPSEFSAVVGIRFRPGAARVFFPVSAHELHNTDVPLADLDSGEADRLLNELCVARGERAQLQVVENYLHRKVSVASPVPPAIRYAVEQLSRDGEVNIRKVQLDVGMSHTRFIQLFREHIGFTPKLFHRVRRFRSVLNRVEAGMPVNWAAMAADCGYFDQAHLIRDFRAFSGVTPLEYGRTIPGVKNELSGGTSSS